MHTFYAPDIAPALAYTLSEEESKHAVKVLRVKESDEVKLIDGKGSTYIGRVADAHHKRCMIAFGKPVYERPNWPHIHIAVAPTKNNDRMEWFLEKATEIGITRITPLLCDHSERKVIKPERFEKILVAAMKQSQRSWLPELAPLTSFADFVHSEKTEHRYIAHCDEGEKELLKTVYKPGCEATVLIGPEGDFSPEEVKLALECDFRPISLGESRLRTETAALVACHTLNLISAY